MNDIILGAFEMLRVIACDDDRNMLGMLENCVREYMEEYSVSAQWQYLAYENGIDLIYDLEHTISESGEIFILDIKLKNDNGITVAKTIKSKKRNAVIIFISGYTEYIEDSFEADPVYFLVKPLKKDAFYKAMNKAIEKIHSVEKKFLIIKNKEVIRIFYDEILYAESIARKIHIHCHEENVEYYEKMDELTKKMGSHFVRCHKSYLVNMKYIKSVDNKEITLLNGMKIPVSRTKATETKERVLEYLKISI